MPTQKRANPKRSARSKTTSPVQGTGRAATPEPVPDCAACGEPPPRSQRRDLLTFVNSLYSGAVALGVARFIATYDTKLRNKSLGDGGALSDLLYLVVAASFLVPAVAFVLDDWRHARWVNEDYGYRLDPKGNTLRYWHDCVIAIAAFFFVSSSLFGPPSYVFWFGVILTMGWLWALTARREIRAHISTAHHFPRNALGITIAEARKLEPEVPESADYRVQFIIKTHWVGLLLMAVGLVGVASTALADLVASIDGAIGRGQGLLDWVRDKCGIVAATQGWIGTLFAFLFIGAKFHYHRSRKSWVERRRALCGKEVVA